MSEEIKYKQADEGQTENPLQELRVAMCRSSKDFSTSKWDAFLYGIIVGWDEAAYIQLKDKLGWTDEQIAYQKQLHANYEKAWVLLNQNGII